MRKNNITILIQFLVGIFILPEYYYHIIPILKINKSTNQHNDTGYKHQKHNRYSHFKNKSKNRIRSFDRNSKVNFN